MHTCTCKSCSHRRMFRLCIIVCIVYLYIYICTYTCVNICTPMHMDTCVCMYIYIYIHAHTPTHIIYIYIYIYGQSPHELPTLVLCRKNRVKPAFPVGPDSVSLKVCQDQTHIARERARQLLQVRREHAVNGNTVLFQP